MNNRFLFAFFVATLSNASSPLDNGMLIDSSTQFMSPTREYNGQSGLHSIAKTEQDLLDRLKEIISTPPKSRHDLAHNAAQLLQTTPVKSKYAFTIRIENQIFYFPEEFTQLSKKNASDRDNIVRMFNGNSLLTFDGKYYEAHHLSMRDQNTFHSPERLVHIIFLSSNTHHDPLLHTKVEESDINRVTFRRHRKQALRKAASQLYSPTGLEDIKPVAKKRRSSASRTFAEHSYNTRYKALPERNHDTTQKKLNFASDEFNKENE